MKKNIKTFTDDDMLIAQFAKALSHPARVYIMRELSKMNACCTSGEMIQNLPIARSTLSQHLKELKLAGLIQGNITGLYIKYCINSEKWELAKKSISKLVVKQNIKC